MPRSLLPARAPAPAFTLVETVMVLTLLAILAGIAIPRYTTSLSHYRADLAARRLAADIALAQASAKSQSMGRGILFDVGSNSYSLTGVSALDAKSGLYTVSLSKAPSAAVLGPVTFDRATPDATLRFDGFGKPDQGVTATIRSGTFTRTVIVDPQTGVATVN